MRKKKILLHTNPTWIKTGLAENAKTLLKHLWATKKYDIVHYCSQVSVGDQNLTLSPWKSHGCIPNDQNTVNELNQDPYKARNASYGSYNIDAVIQAEKPDIYIGSDDIWGFPKSDYCDKSWYKKLSPVLHITVDSLPILEQAFEQATVTPTYLTWAKFAQKEMMRFGPKFQHIGQIYGAMDTQIFSPISTERKAELRKRFGISDDTTVFLFVFRNQLRKSANLCMEAFARFKKQNPGSKVKLHFHTSFSEKGNGWDIPKMAAYYGIDIKGILATYTCKKCGQWFISPYQGEDLKCPACGEEKGLITVNIGHGVPSGEMKDIYGFSDACLSIFTSGGQEYHSVQSLLCGKPLACTNYSCGEDFCNNDFVFPIKYHTYHEAGTNFIKAANDVNQIVTFYSKIVKASKNELIQIGNKGRKWAIDNFSIEVIGKQWEKLFDSLPFVDWTDFTFKNAVKNPSFPFPEIEDDLTFVQILYKEILMMNEPPQSEGVRHWMERLKNGVPRKEVYGFFIKVATDENNKNQKPHDFNEVLEKTGKKRGLMVIKESIGDIFMSTALFESFHENHPDTDLYIACDPQYFELLTGNPYVYKVLNYMPAFENEMSLIGVGQKEGYFDYYYHIAIQTQRVLSYLSHPEPAFKLE